jgi:hypothetical protein
MLPAIPEPKPVINFYAAVIDDSAVLAEAQEIDGVDHEIALLRERLRKRIKEHPKDYQLMLKSVELIVRAVAARYRMSPQNARDLAASIEQTLRRVADEVMPQRVTDV